MNKDIKKRSCDIIIPIYNAYDCVVECIDSVIKYTNLEENHLILINDKSSDIEIAKLLDEYKNRNPKFTVLHNKENLGFVKTVNRGMRLSNNDVLLLNSDTIVTLDWLDKLKECAYSQEMVATAIPLSNNATLASVPNIFNKNDLEADMSIDEMAKIVEDCSYKDYPELPTAHGFCMYIKRSVLKEVGFFDEDAFGKGYGEENDFCFRCFDHGYKHLLCDDAYVYHKESQSFSEAKYALMSNAEEVLNNRYPQYQHRLREWCINPPIKYIGQNIAFEIGRKEKKENILILVHDWTDIEKNLGGTTLHVYDIIKSLRNIYNFHVLTREGNFYKLYSYWTNGLTIIKYPRTMDFKDFGFYNEVYKGILDKVMSDFCIKIVHIHHMMGHYFDIINVVKQYNLYSIVSIHDFYAVCPIVNKMFKRKQYCGNPTVKKCGDCLRFSLEKENNMIEPWRRMWNGLFDTFDTIITPSESAKQELLMTYNNIDVKVIEHGIDLKKEKSDLSISEDRSFDIAFVGVIDPHKGKEVFEYLIRSKKLKKVRIHLFGKADIDPPIRSRYYVDHGTYKRKDLTKLLKEHKIKLVCLFSMCPESYSYTLSESVASGVPVLGVDLGAIGYRIRKDNLGWLIDPCTKKEDYPDKIMKVLSDPKVYSDVIDSLNKYSIKTTKEMVGDYYELYSSFQINLVNNTYNTEGIRMQLKITDTHFPQFTNIHYPNYSWVFDTMKWKIISRLKIPTPIKNFYKKSKNFQTHE
jgi:GT2 family glycosyltransferase/glycosyltransferase involved in cell wall biosynthesis